MNNTATNTATCPTVRKQIGKTTYIKRSQPCTAGNQNAFGCLARDEKSRTFSSNSRRSHILRTSSRSIRLILSSIFRSLGDIAQATGCAIVLIGHLNKAAGTQSTYRGLGSIDITAAVRSLLFIGKLKDSPTTRVLIHEKSSLAPPGQSLAFSLGDEKGFEWKGVYDITADELLAGTDTAKTESKTAQAEMLILELLADGKKMPSAELEKTVNERGISSRTMRTAKSRIGDRLVTEKDGTAWVCYLRN